MINLMLFSNRDGKLESVTPSQWDTFYRRAKPGQEGATYREGGPVIPVITPADLPPLRGHATTLPSVVEVIREDRGGQRRVYRLRRKPQLLDWRPRSNYADIYQFSVSIIALKSLLIYD